ncbi:Arabinose-proton symporter [Grifola frondosa]|uniref:Arabinose-proton symporter n=1 Tax=Grifola frondosa TaxID=5627 RepID=A0A1C7LVZ1_GRIFR|nr:Arabinose-proton symporter [Grifola frondosa]
MDRSSPSTMVHSLYNLALHPHFLFTAHSFWRRRSCSSSRIISRPPSLSANMSNDNEKISVEKRERDSVSETYSREVKPIDNTRQPLANIPHDQLIADAAAFADTHGLGQHSEQFQKGALVAQDPTAFESLSQLSDEDKNVLRRELTHRWEQPGQLYYLVIMCSLAAAVQGMDESVINGANLFYAPQFGIDPNSGNTSRNQWLLGLVNSAPYLCCGLFSCWLSAPMNKYFGRRGTIFISATLSFLTCIWQGVTNSWEHLFVARFILGFGIGPKSATVPVYAAECTPPVIRGALVMMWQMWTAFGIMIGNVCDLAFYHVPDKPHITGLNWRLMLSSAGIPALIIMTQVFFCPESPRWLISKGRYDQAYESLLRLRNSPLQAARDLYYIHVMLEAEKEIQTGRNLFLELFTVARNRRATLASTIVMFMQQFCGVNVIAYYSSNIFSQANFTNVQALIASWGFGMLNWVFAFPAVYTIDTFGRRNLLLTTFPLMAVFLLMTGFAFWIPEGNARIAVVALGIYLFTMAYSPGEGPVPFTYSAEAFPLYVRDIGMAWATSVLWFFNFVVAITFPRLLGAFKPQGAFGWYAGWNVIGFFLILFFLPETKALSLEELDQGAFSLLSSLLLPRSRADARMHAAYQLKALPRNIKKYFLRMRVDDLPPLYEHECAIGEKHYAPGGAGAAFDWVGGIRKLASVHAVMGTGVRKSKNL